MKILIIDHNSLDIQTLITMLQTLDNTIKIDIAHHLDNASDLFSKEKYAFVFINYDFTDGKIFAQYLCKHYKKQPLIAISSLFDCDNKFDCKFCKESKNRFKLMKPLTFNDLIKILSLQKNQEKCYCDYNYLLLKLKKVTCNYHNFLLDTYSYTIVNKNSYLKRKENLPNLTQELDTLHIAYHLDSLDNVKIITTS